MQKLFDEVGSLDKRCYEEFGLSEDILMEHAANGIATYIRQNFAKNSKVLIACGSGNNGADGIALARLLHEEYLLTLLYAKEPKSAMALLQEKRAKRIGVRATQEILEYDVIVDAIVGTGFKGEFSSELETLIQTLNATHAFKIACDIPSGIDSYGNCAKSTFRADVSLTMGALKKSMFLDEAKEYVGKIEVLNLGVSRKIYETDSHWKLLDENDLELPYREKKDTHKGSFGHLAIASGEKSGASILSGLSALRFGSGLVTLVGYENKQTTDIPYSLMYSHTLPQNATALACGMGLGLEFSDVELEEFLDNSLPLIVDADIFHMKVILDVLQRKELVLTPHPKEFVSLLRLSGVTDIEVDELQKNRFKYVELFCKKFPHVVLLLKGANVIIGKGESFYVNPHGTSKLAKGGSGDVLSGLIGALLAQGSDTLNATINASLAHTASAKLYDGSDFSMTPLDLIESLRKL